MKRWRGSQISLSCQRESMKQKRSSGRGKICCKTSKGPLWERKMTIFVALRDSKVDNFGVSALSGELQLKSCRREKVSGNEDLRRRSFVHPSSATKTLSMGFFDAGEKEKRKKMGGIQTRRRGQGEEQEDELSQTSEFQPLTPHYTSAGFFGRFIMATPGRSGSFDPLAKLTLHPFPEALTQKDGGSLGNKRHPQLS